MTERYSPMSINQLINNNNDNDKIEADVRLAVEALGDLSKSGTTNTTADNKIILPPLSIYSSEPSTSPSSPLPTPSNLSEASRFSFSSDFTTSSMEEEITASQQYHYQQQQQQQQSQPFMHRVSNIPLVNSALRAYEKSTAQNMVKYGTDMVESFTAPIYDKFGKSTPHVNIYKYEKNRP